MKAGPIPSEVWVEETLHQGWRQRFLVQGELTRVRSAFQEIVIVETESHGRVMLLDGAVQITERDEFVYQEMLVHVPLLTHGFAKHVLIIGAGDGGVLRRVLRHRNVERATMVEIDAEVVRLSRQFLSSIGGGAWTDKRADVRIEDGIRHVVHADTCSVDVIIVDSTDPIGAAEVLFTDEFYRNCARVLKPDGIMVNQAGVPFMQSGELTACLARMRKYFRQTGAYVASVPTYIGGMMALGYATNSDKPLCSDTDLIRERARECGVLGSTSYWSPEVQIAAFALPPYIEKVVCGREEQLGSSLRVATGHKADPAT